MSPTSPDVATIVPLDRRVDGELRELGVSIVGPLLGDVECRHLEGVFSDEVGADSVGLGWFTSGMLQDPARRSNVFQQVGSVLLPLLRQVLDPGSAEVMAGHFHVNPNSGVGGLGPHQDVAIVDERGARSVNGWIPLTDSDTGNGTLQVVRRSHLLGNHDRSLAMPWAYEGLHDLFWELAEPIEVPAGTLVLFDTAIVHGSGPNTGTDTRLAVNCLMKPTTVPLIHLVVDDSTAPGAVDAYEVPLDYYLQGDLSGRPDPAFGFAWASRPVHTPDADPSVIRQICSG